MRVGPLVFLSVATGVVLAIGFIAPKQARVLAELEERTRSVQLREEAALVQAKAFEEKATQLEKELTAMSAKLDAAPPPPPVTEYMGRQVAPAMSYHGGASWLLREMRDKEEATTKLMPELGLKPGMTVCDLGSGNGYHSLMMAPLVAPEGKVLAVDIQQEMLTDLRSRAEVAKITNIETVLGDVHTPKLPPQSCDLIFLADVYHEFSHPEPMLAAMRRSLKPGGLVALVEFRGEDPNVPIKPEHKMTKDQIRKEWEANGFTIAREYDGLPWQHLIFLRAK